MYLLQHTSNRGIRSWWFFPPGGDKNFDVGVSSVPEPVHSQLDSPAREGFFISMTTMRKQRHLQRNRKGSSRVFFPGNSLDHSLIIKGNQANLHFENRSFFAQNISLNWNQLACDNMWRVSGSKGSAFQGLMDKILLLTEANMDQERVVNVILVFASPSKEANVPHKFHCNHPSMEAGRKE